MFEALQTPFSDMTVLTFLLAVAELVGFLLVGIAVLVFLIGVIVKVFDL